MNCLGKTVASWSPGGVRRDLGCLVEMGLGLKSGCVTVLVPEESEDQTSYRKSCVC